MDLYSILLTLSRATMLLPRRRVDWILEDTNTTIEMDLQQYMFRSFCERLLEDGTSKDELYAVLKQMYVDENEYATGECFSVIFH
jgi:hypothetical protein